ncbi:MAG TPA: hypothetical protein VGL10_06245 [Gammaproteobacteria bacterium]
MSSALQHLFKYLEEIRPASVSLPLLGCRYGKLPAAICLELIYQTLLAHRDMQPLQIHIHMDQEYLAQAYRIFGDIPSNEVHHLFSQN